jgi:DNA-binding GntR family transcriptional regulator
VEADGDPDVREVIARLRSLYSLDSGEWLELTPSLLILEAVAVRELPPFDAAAIAELRAANERLRESAGDSTKAAHADHDFHRLLLARCRNQRVLDAIDPVRRALLDYERVYMLSRERLARSVAEHEAIIVALEQGDNARAAALVRANYTSGMPEVAAQLSDAADG